MPHRVAAGSLGLKSNNQTFKALEVIGLYAPQKVTEKSSSLFSVEEF